MADTTDERAGGEGDLAAVGEVLDARRAPRRAPAPATTLAAGLRAEFGWMLARTQHRSWLAAVGAQPG